VTMTMSKPPALVENLKYTITDLGGNKGKLTLEWGTTALPSPLLCIEFRSFERGKRRGGVLQIITALPIQ